MKNVLGLIIVVSALLVSCGKEDDGFTFEEQLAIDIAKIDDYLDKNSIDTEIHSSGIRYIETTVGSGSAPIEGEIAVIKYEIKLLGGDQEVVGLSEYGSSLPMNSTLLRAFYIMLQEMNEGGELTCFVPSGYAFGDQSIGLITPNTNLEFNVELLFVVKDEEDQLAADEAIIDGYLADNNITDVLIHESGIRYTVQKEGSGDLPTLENFVTTAYKGSFLNGIIFDQNTNATFGLDGLIEAWKIMIPTMKKNDAITIYAPSKYCYGPAGNSSIPANENLIFEIELLSFE